MELDSYDRKILQILQDDGRISNQDLADRIGLSTSRKRLSAPPTTPTSFAAFCDFLTRRGYGRYIEMASAY